MKYPNYQKLEEFTIILFIILSGFFVTALDKLNNFYTFPNLDEMLWHYRSSVFWDKLPNFDFSGLIQSAQPGITVYWFTGFMMKFIDFDFTDITKRIAEKNAEGLDFNYVVNANDPVIYKMYETISFYFNIPLILLTVVFFISFYYLLRKLKFNKIISYSALFFLTTNIFLSHWTTPSDKMLNIFITLSFLTFLVYINKFGNRKYLYLSAVFGSWAVLSKLSALFLLPFYSLIFILYAWPINTRKIKLIIKDYSTWILIFILTNILFLPTILTHPQEVYNLVFSSRNVIEETYQIKSYIDKVIFDYFKSFILVIVGQTAQASAVTILAYLVIRLRKKYRYVLVSLNKKIIQSVDLYIILFIIMVTIISSNHDIRFMSPAFTMLSLISAIGLYGIFELMMKKIKFNHHERNFFFNSVMFVILFSQIIFITLNGLLIKEFLKLIGD